jgi:predicted ester cyclase
VTEEPGAVILHGVDRFIAHGKGLAEAFPDSRLEVLGSTVQGNRAVVEGTYNGTQTGPLASPQGVVPPTGRTLALRFCETFEVTPVASQRIGPTTIRWSSRSKLGLIPVTA